MTEAMRKVLYSSHPIANYQLGKFQFEKTVLTLEGDEDIGEFEKLYETLPPAEKSRIKKIDVDAAEAFVRKVLDQMPKATQNIDSSVGGDATRARGTGDLSDTNPKPESGENPNDEGLGVELGLGGLSNTGYGVAGFGKDSTTPAIVPNRETDNRGVIGNGALPSGSGDATSGENHGAGNVGHPADPTEQELIDIASGQGTESNEDQKAALDLLDEANKSEDTPDDKPASTSGIAGLLNRNK